MYTFLQDFLAVTEKAWGIFKNIWRPMTFAIKVNLWGEQIVHTDSDNK